MQRTATSGSSNPRLLIISVDFLPRVGGISTMIHHFANALEDSDVSVTIFAPKGAMIPSDFQNKYRLLEDKGFTSIAREGRQSMRETQRVVSLLDDLHRKAAFTHVFLMHPYHYGSASLIFSQKNSIDLTAFFYGYELNCLLANPPGRLKRIFKRASGFHLSTYYRTMEIIEKANNIAAISSFTAGLVELAAPGARQRTVLTGCGISDVDYQREISISPGFARDQRRLRRNDLGLSQRRTIGFTGRLVPSKNVATLLRAVSLLEDVDLVVVGSGPESGSLMQLTQDLGVVDRVTWKGKVSEAEKWALLRSFDAFVLPSIELPNGQVEGFGIVLLEATAAGCPVVAAKSGGMVDVVADEQTGFLFEPLNASSLSARLESLLNNDILSQKLVENARHQIEERFNWKTIAEKLSTLL